MKTELRSGHTMVDTQDTVSSSEVFNETLG